MPDADLTADRSDYRPPERIRRLPSWLLAQAARRGQELVAASLAPEGARRQHFTVLASLSEDGPASQAELGRRLWIDRSDLHELVSQLEREGLVARARDARDQRRKVVTLTPLGDAALARFEQRIEAAQQALVEPLSRAERAELSRLLRKLLAAM
jgi:MarR family transcriptional regulator, lower aerobic nicotinate degradation pathway regulator